MREIFKFLNFFWKRKKNKQELQEKEEKKYRSFQNLWFFNFGNFWKNKNDWFINDGDI